METEEEEEKVDFKYTLSEYWDLIKKYKIFIFGILFLVFFLESRHILESYLFKILIDKGTLFAAGTITKETFVGILLVLLAVFGFIVFSGFLGRWFEQHWVNILESKIMIDLKKKYFSHLIELDYSFHTTHKTGIIISRLSRGSNGVEKITDVFVYEVASVIFSFIVVIASLIYFDFYSAITIFCVIAVFISYSYIMQGITQKANIISNLTEDKEKGNVSDIFTNVESIKYFGKENFIERKFSEIIENTKKAFMKYVGYYRWIDSVHSLTIGIGTFLVLYFPLMRFLDGEITLGTLVFIYAVYGDMIEPLYGFVYGLRNVYGALADFQSLFEYGKIEQKVKDSPNAKNLKITDGEIEFRNVDFSYGNRKIFEGFNLTIPKNKKIALVGQSGSGKTTIVKLLYRFYDIDSGQILIDGKDIKDFKQQSLRSEMSIVPQECILFDDTIYNNIAFSNSSASREEVLKAIKVAHLDNIIDSFPDKENTIVGERGVKLSGGEKQRVSIARAILADKEILVLDEATSALDSETEYEIQKDLNKLMEERTSIIIAHRLSTIMHADKIIVFRNGKIVQEGRHSKLIEETGEYRKLWNLQKEGYLEENK